MRTLSVSTSDYNNEWCKLTDQTYIMVNEDFCEKNNIDIKDVFFLVESEFEVLKKTFKLTNAQIFKALKDNAITIKHLFHFYYCSSDLLDRKYFMLIKENAFKQKVYRNELTYQTNIHVYLTRTNFIHLFIYKLFQYFTKKNFKEFYNSYIELIPRFSKKFHIQENTLISDIYSISSEYNLTCKDIADILKNPKKAFEELKENSLFKFYEDGFYYTFKNELYNNSIFVPYKALEEKDFSIVENYTQSFYIIEKKEYYTYSQREFFSEFYNDIFQDFKKTFEKYIK